jgi:hypothetical protein
VHASGCAIGQNERFVGCAGFVAGGLGSGGIVGTGACLVGFSRGPRCRSIGRDRREPWD